MLTTLAQFLPLTSWKRSRWLCAYAADPTHTPASVLDSSGAMQDARLNYVQQHAQRAGMDEDRLEDLRVAASKSSPMGDALDLCVRYTDEEALSRLGPKLTQLIR